MNSRIAIHQSIIQKRLLSVSCSSTFDVDLVAENYARRTEWAACNYGNKGSHFDMILPPPNVTGKLHLGHALTVVIEDSFCRHHRIKGRVAKWTPGFDHAGIATQSIVERKLWKEKQMLRTQISPNEFFNYCINWSQENSKYIEEQLKRLGATLDWNNCYYTLDEKFSSAVTRAFCELFAKKLIYRDKRIVNWCPTLSSSLSDQEVERMDFKAPVELSIPCPSGGKRLIKVGEMYTIRYRLDNGSYISVGTTRPETIFADVALAVHPEDERYSKYINHIAKHPFLPGRILPIIADKAVIRDKGTGVLKITPAHDSLDFDIASRHWKRILQYDPHAETRYCIDESGRIFLDSTFYSTLNENDYIKQFHGLDRFEARTKMIELLRSTSQLGNSQKNDGGQISLCSRTGDIIDTRLTEQWFMDTTDMHKEAEKAFRTGLIKITPSFHEGKLYDWLNNKDPWCISRQLSWGHRIPAYKQTYGNEWITAKTENEAKLHLATSDIIQDPDVLDTWFSSSLVPLVHAGWMEKDFNPSKIPLNVLETGWDILGFWVVRMIIIMQCLTGQIPFSEIVLHGLIRDSSGRKMSKSLGNIIDPHDILDGITLTNMIKRLEDSSLNSKEIELAAKDLRKRYPEGIPKAGADALRFALLRHDVLANDIALNVTDHVGEGMRFCNKLWNLVNYMDKVIEKSGSKKEVDSDHIADAWIMSRLAKTLSNVDEYMKARSPHLAFNTLHKFILGNLCDVYLETTKKALWNDDKKRIQEIRTTLNKVVQPILVQLSVFMPFVAEHLYEKVFRREAGSIYFDFVKPSFFSYYRNIELESKVDIALAAISAVRSIKQQLQLSHSMQFEGYLITDKSGMQEINEIVNDLVGLNIISTMKSACSLPKEFILCNLPGFEESLALKIEESDKHDFISRLQRLLSQTEKRKLQFSEKAKKFEEIVGRDKMEAKVKTHIINKNIKKAQQAASVAENCQKEYERIKSIIESVS